MKKIVVACATGMATSQTVATKMKKLLANEGVTNIEIEAMNMAQLPSCVKDFDIFVCLTPASDDIEYNIPMFDGIKILTGLGQKEEIQKIIKEINK